MRIFIENKDMDNLDDIIYGDNFELFKDYIRSYHGMIENGLIVRFYLNEFLKHYDSDVLSSLDSFKSLIKMVHDVWEASTNKNQHIAFRRGGESGEMFFSDNIYVASVYGGALNAYIIDFKNPFIMDCDGADWMDIDEPQIMGGHSYDGKVSTDNVVEFIKKNTDHDGVVFKNLYEGSGAGVFGASTIYVSLYKNTYTNLTNNK